MMLDHHRHSWLGWSARKLERSETMLCPSRLQATALVQSSPSTIIGKNLCKKWAAFALILSLLDAQHGYSFEHSSVGRSYYIRPNGACCTLNSPYLERHPFRRGGALRRNGIKQWIQGRNPRLLSSSYRYTTSCLSATPNVPFATPTVRAGASLVLSTLIGLGAERWLFSGSGLLVTLATAATLTNAVGWAPRTHALYDWSWSTGLPASLVFLLLSLRSEKNPPPADTSSSPRDFANNGATSSPMAAVRRLALPFLVASIGSVLGCVGSFELCRLGHPSFSTAGLWLLSPKEACLAAACLAASFVGGSVNFFATASILSRTSSRGAAPLSMSTSNLVSSMAAADLVVMAIYFASLGVMVNSLRLRRWLRGTVDGGQLPSSSLAREVEPPMKQNPTTTVSEERPTLHGTTLPQRGAAAFLASLLALGAVQVAHRAERRLTPVVPGTACAVIAVLVPLLQRGARRLVAGRPHIEAWNHHVSTVSAVMTQICFLWLFASVGMTADVAAALRDGPACFVFSLTSLGIHLGFLLGVGRLLQNHRSRRRSSRPSGNAPSLDELLVASNAAIGGPATAAAFCGQLPSTCPDKAGLTVAATMYGVLGYAVGTTLGVTLHRILANYAKLV